MLSFIKTVCSVVASALLCLGVLYSASLLPVGERATSRLETIHGIPYPIVDDATHIDEPLAHADIYINQPVLGQELVLSLKFIPTNINTLSVGVRENSFWLSYPKYTIYSRDNLLTTNYSLLTKSVTIPLTDKLQEPDRSIDLMFFAEGEDPQWKLLELKTEIKHIIPSYVQFKDYARAILKRERAL